MGFATVYDMTTLNEDIFSFIFGSYLGKAKTLWGESKIFCLKKLPWCV